MLSDRTLKKKSLEYRRDTLHWIKHAGVGDIAASFSCIDILNVLYNRVLKVNPHNVTSLRRDRYIHSKACGVEALYVVLADIGFFDKVQLAELYRYRSPFVASPTHKVVGIDHSTDSSGQSLAVSVGMALGEKLDRIGFRVFTLLSNGDLNQGAVWEAAMTAAHYQLDALTAIVDNSHWQRHTKDCYNSTTLTGKFTAFGWAVENVNGHDIGQLTRALQQAPQPDKPTAIIAQTTKAKGVSFMENISCWHQRVPDDKQYIQAIEELSSAIENIENSAC